MRFAILLCLALTSVAHAAPCDSPSTRGAAAAANGASLTGSSWTFTEGREGAEEGPGWEVYLPLTQQTIGTTCPAGTPGFAEALATWQSANGLKPTGEMAPATAERLKIVWHAARRQAKRAATETCREAEAGELVDVAAADVWGKPEKLLPGAYAAYRTMMAAARAEAPDIFTGNVDLKIVSAWRTRARDVETCKTRKCSRVSMAPSCSIHWSGAALDLNVGFIEGHSPADMDYANRLHQTRQAAYLWLLKNAGRFGFANYFAEPWHWEWNG